MYGISHKVSVSSFEVTVKTIQLRFTVALEVALRDDVYVTMAMRR